MADGRDAHGFTGGQPAARRLDREDPLPLWAQLVADLRRRLDAGEFPDRFPSEPVLAEEYEVSRHTVREAVRRLRTSGALVAQRGRGSFVTQSRIEQPLGAIYSLFRSVEAQGVTQRSVVRALDRRRDPVAAERLQLDPDAALVHLERLRFAGDEPLALDRAWLPAEVAEPLLDTDFTHTALYDELERLCGLRLTGGRERITAAIADPATAGLLALPADTAVLTIERLGTAADRPLEWRESVVRADRFAVVSEWSPSSAYRLDLVGGATGTGRGRGAAGGRGGGRVGDRTAGPRPRRSVR
jgi:GntR family transcriptional regulator